jgi:hypothetical protein
MQQNFWKKWKKTPLLPGSPAPTPGSGCSDLPAWGRIDPTPVAAVGARRGLPLPVVAGARWGPPRPSSTAGALVECTAASRRIRGGSVAAASISAGGEPLPTHECRRNWVKRGKRRGGHVCGDSWRKEKTGWLRDPLHVLLVAESESTVRIENHGRLRTQHSGVTTKLFSSAGISLRDCEENNCWIRNTDGPGKAHEKSHSLLGFGLPY